jgi:uncharacterized protein (DUF342 family)
MSGRLTQVCADLRAGTNPEKILVAKSYLPPPGPDGRIEISLSTTTDDAHYVIDEQGRIDFRSRHAIANVSPGQKVGILYPPEMGDPGTTVTAALIPPVLGKAFEFVGGFGIRLDDDGRTILADAPGRLIFDGKCLSVSDEFVVPGDVNYGVGHIEFSGFVHVKGDVLDEFNIKATKGIQIDGVTGACQLTAGGDINLLSVFGKGDSIIRCTGNLQANLLNGVTIECHGNVTVNGEIRDSTIRALGAVIAKTICGGETSALMGVEAKTIGAKCGTPSIISAGINFMDPERKSSLQVQLQTIKKAVSKAEDSITALSKQVEKTEIESVGIHLKARRKELRELLMTLEILEEELHFFQIEKELIPNPKINITGIMHDGVLLNLGKTKHEVKNEIIGPATLINNPLDTGFTTLPLSPLKELAETLQSDIVELHGQVHEKS